jgi:nicotinamide-nucleotide amidase
MVRAELILIGSELLNGSRSDSHLAFLGRSLAEAGIVLERCSAVGDDARRIADIAREAANRSDLLIVSGGLGPTIDDVTRDAIAAAFKKPLELDREALTALERFFERIDVPLSDATRRQAYFPAGARPLPNRVGTAAGFALELPECLLFILPGPPRELRPMVLEYVIPQLRSKFSEPPLYSRTFRTAGVGESALAELFEPLYERFSLFSFSSLPARGCVDIIVTEKRDAPAGLAIDERAAALETELKRLLGVRLYGTGEATLEGAVGELLARRRETLSIAESLTGGMLGTRLTDMPGSSRFLLADVVAYSDEAKSDFLGVAGETLLAFGAVSEQVCAEMADGVRRRTDASWGIATTGIAGPDGGSGHKPVGLCYYGMSWRGGSDIRRSVFPGSRAHVRERVTNALLLMLYEKLYERS